jgi:hypothetical protein
MWLNDKLLFVGGGGHQSHNLTKTWNWVYAVYLDEYQLYWQVTVISGIHNFHYVSPRKPGVIAKRGNAGSILQACSQSLTLEDTY